MGNWIDGKSSDSIELGYDPIDRTSITGFKRPPNVPGCFLDYFKALIAIKDEGKFAHEEAEFLINFPEVFFEEPMSILYELDLRWLHHIEVGEYNQVFLCYIDGQKVRINTEGITPELPNFWIYDSGCILNKNRFKNRSECIEDWKKVITE